MLGGLLGGLGGGGIPFLGGGANNSGPGSVSIGQSAGDRGMGLADPMLQGQMKPYVTSAGLQPSGQSPPPAQYAPMAYQQSPGQGSVAGPSGLLGGGGGMMGGTMNPLNPMGFFGPMGPAALLTGGGGGIFGGGGLSTQGIGDTWGDLGGSGNWTKETGALAGAASPFPIAGAILGGHMGKKWGA